MLYFTGEFIQLKMKDFGFAKNGENFVATPMERN